MVAAEDIYIHALLFALLGQRADQVVSFITCQLHTADAVQIKKILNHRHLGSEVVGHALAVCLIFGAHLMSECRFPAVEKNAHVVRVIFLHDAKNGIEESVDGARRRSVRCSHGSSADHGIVSSVHYRIAVNKKECTHN